MRYLSEITNVCLPVPVSGIRLRTSWRRQRTALCTFHESMDSPSIWENISYFRIGAWQCAYNELSERATTACIMPYRISNRIPHCTDNHAEIRELITTNHIKIKISHLVHALSRDGASGCLRASARASHKHDQFAISISFCQFIFVVFVVVTIGTLQEPLDWSGCCNCALDNRIVFECKRSNVFVTILFDFFFAGFYARFLNWRCRRRCDRIETAYMRIRGERNCSH